MNILYTIIFGAIAGSIASYLMNKGKKNNLFVDTILGIVGGFAGGFVMDMLAQPGISGFNLYSLAVSVGGACLLIWLSKAIR